MSRYQSEVMHSRPREYEPRTGGRGYSEGSGGGGERRGGHRPNAPRRDFAKDKYPKDKVTLAGTN